MPGFHFPAALVILRVVCGLFFLPHAIGKFTAREAAFKFFEAAGFKPAPPFAYAAVALEVGLAALLVAGVYARPVAGLAAVYLFIAAAAVIKVEKRWLWHIGGCEYPVFWGICCLIVAAAS
jgi:putative oxidoreductase